MPGTGHTRVLISFGAISGGFEFTMQLRHDIYRKFGVNPESNPYFCYLDAESLRINPSTSFKYNAASDTTFASNPDWNGPYRRAMSECSTMIILLTKEWLTSRWCLEELGLAVAESRKRPNMRNIVVKWPDAEGVLREGTWKTRKYGTTAASADIGGDIAALKNRFEIRVAGGVPCVGAITRAGAIVGNNTYNYSCSAAETGLILGQVV